MVSLFLSGEILEKLEDTGFFNGIDQQLPFIQTKTAPNGAVITHSFLIIGHKSTFLDKNNICASSGKMSMFGHNEIVNTGFISA